MANKSIQDLLRGADLAAVATATELPEKRVRAIVLDGDVMHPSEAIALANHLKVDAKGLLDRQTKDQLEKLQYAAPKESKPTKATKTGIGSSHQSVGRRGYDNI